MVATSYSYAIAATAIGKVFSAKLAKEIAAAGLVGLDRIDTIADELLIYFSDAVDEPTLAAVVAAHNGTPPTPVRFIATSKMVNDSSIINSMTDWQDIGGVRSNAAALVNNITKAFGRVIGEVNGTGGEMRVIKSSNGSALSATYMIPDTSGAWLGFSFNTDAQPTDGTDTYILQGRLNGVVAAQVRFTSLTLLELL